MYPESPNLITWRLAGAAALAAKGSPLPAWYDGTDANQAKLMNSLPGPAAALRFEMNAWALAHPADFTPAHLEILARQNGVAGSAAQAAANYTPIDLTVAEKVVNGVANGVAAVVDPVVSTVKDAKDYWFGKEVKEDPKGFLIVAGVGIALGAVAWWVFGRRAA